MHRKSRIILIAPDKHVHKSCAIQISTGKHSTGIVDHTNQEQICLGIDLDHGIGNRDLISLMCAKLKFQTPKFNPLVLLKFFFFTRYHKPSRSLAFFQRTDFPAGAGPGRDMSLGGERELSGVSIDCIAPVS